MRPVTSLPPGHANCDWGISVRCHYQGCVLVRVFVFLSISLCATGNRLVFMPMKSFTQFTLSSPCRRSFFLSPSFISVFFLSFLTPSLLPPISYLSPFHPSSPPVPSSSSSSSSPRPVNTVIAWGALQCITDLSPLVLFMALSLFKFNQASMEPPEPFQFTTWTPQDGKSYANIKV